jgi:hypothetical protein
LRERIEQVVPLKHGAGIAHKRWHVDLEAAARFCGVTAVRMAREASEMAAHFPRWLLALTRDGQPIRCRACDGLFVFDRGVRCVQCDSTSVPRHARGGWFGVVPPVGIDGLAKLRPALLAKPPQRHVVGHREGLGNFLLVPLVVTYPAEYPAYPPNVFYLPSFRDIPGVPSDEYSHELHMIGVGRMCLYATGEWTDALTCRDVLQQRAYPHVIKFLNYANGKRDAFAIVSKSC